MQMSSDELEEISGLLKGTSSLRTLLTGSRHKDLTGLKLTSLRAMCCTDLSVMPCQIVNTTH
uniref:Uncharacterized protein n=1 Tax=Arundo donax TaxID=35708 RepID=A0A0A8Z2C3_ARUDO